MRGPEKVDPPHSGTRNSTDRAAEAGAGRWWKFYFVQGLTLVRVPLIFVFLAVSVFFGYPLSEVWFIVAFGAMILSAVTDMFDGYFARKFQVTSQLGSYADPMTDKIFYLASYHQAGRLSSGKMVSHGRNL